MFVDVHTHIQQHDPDELPGIVERAEAVGVGAIIAAGVTVDDSRRCIEIAREHQSVFAGVGVHPTAMDGALILAVANATSGNRILRICTDKPSVRTRVWVSTGR